ncbi:MAG TPA: CDP-alcohol phosphatidyltransferase family protein [Polyangia bacterium]|nr:CDP-alcohol phosphatidyltransferase family protein [Polyangia bacterium]
MKNRPEWWTVPNAMTLGRIVLTPFFGYFWWRHWYELAIITFAVASASDFLDGLAARVLDQRSKLGQLLDPTADKLMVLVTFVVAAATGAVPRWLAMLVIGRDVILASGGALFAFVYRGIMGPERWRPSRIGKYATFYTVGTIGLALLHSMTGAERLRPFVGALGIMCAACTIVSGIQYVASGIKAFVGNAKLAPGGTQEP